MYVLRKQLIAFGLSFSIDYGTSKGLGRHDADIPEHWLSGLYSSEYVFTILYNPALMATKTSILIFYLRMAKNTQIILRVSSYVTLAIVNIAGVVLTFMNAFQCRPIYAAYTPHTQGKCISIVTLYLCSAPVNVITDLAILVLPIPVLTGMRLPRKQKTVLVFTFALGIFVTIIDVIRIYYLQKALDAQAYLISKERLGTSLDFAWTASMALMWSAVEVNVGIVCACIPTLRPLVKLILPSMIMDRSHTEKGASSGDQQPSGSNHVHRAPSAIGDHEQEIQLPPPARIAGQQEREIGMLDFLTTPSMDEIDLGSGISRTRTADTRVSEDGVYFGFIDMKRPKSMLTTSGLESFRYCTIVTLLFFLWGFSYGLLNTLDNEIARIAHQTFSQDLALTSAYFGAYFFGPLTVGQWVLRHGGFKATFITGLCIYGTGTLMFWPSAVLASFPGFIICQFVVGFGLSILETAANPFIALCGPPQYAEYRLLLAQGVQASASVLSQLLAQKVFFSKIISKLSLIDVQWTYLAIALFAVILALFFYYVPLPEATDADLQSLTENLCAYPDQFFLSTKLPLIYVTLALAIFAQFVYVGAQESMSIWFGPLLYKLAGHLTISIDDYGLVAQANFAIGRFLFASLVLLVAPRILILLAFILGTIFAILTMSLTLNANGIAGPALVLFFFEGPIFPLVFAIGLRGMGKRTKYAAAGLTAATSGGAVFPFVMWAVYKVNHKTVQYTFCVVVALFAFGITFPAYLNLVPGARRQVDPRRIRGRDDMSLPDSTTPADDDQSITPIRRLSNSLSIILSRVSEARYRKNSDMLPVIEHEKRQESLSTDPST
jgi:fucose permease